MPTWPLKRHEIVLSEFFPMWNVGTGGIETKNTQVQYSRMQHHITTTLRKKMTAFYSILILEWFNSTLSLSFITKERKKIKRHLFHFLLQFVSISCRCSSVQRIIWNCKLNLPEEVKSMLTKLFHIAEIMFLWLRRIKQNNNPKWPNHVS